MRWREWWLSLINPLALAPELPLPQSTESLLCRTRVPEKKPALNFAPSGSRTVRQRGQGLDFHRLRSYSPGDDYRKIDWNVFARLATPAIKEYQEERQWTFWFVMDLTSSMMFGSQRRKAECALETLAWLSQVAEQQDVESGFLAFTEDRQMVIRPGRGRAHLLAAVAQLRALYQQQINAPGRPISPPENAPKSSIGPECASLQALNRIVARDSWVFLFSDYLYQSADWLDLLGQLSVHRTVVSIICRDPVEGCFPNLGPWRDPETGECLVIEPEELAKYSDALAAYWQQLVERLPGRVHFLESIHEVLLPANY